MRINEGRQRIRQQAVSVRTGGDLVNHGTLGAAQGLGIEAGEVRSTGLLGAGVGADGGVAQVGDLTIDARGTLSAAGVNVAGGDMRLEGATLNLADSQTRAGGDLSLRANRGDLTLARASTDAGGALRVHSEGALDHREGTLSGSSATLTAAALDNRGGHDLRRAPRHQDARRSGQPPRHDPADRQRGHCCVTDDATLPSAGPSTTPPVCSPAMREPRSDDRRVDEQPRCRIEHRGTGVLRVVVASGAASNVSGHLLTNGTFDARVERFDNTGGTVSAQHAATIDAASEVINRDGSLYGADALTLITPGAFDNTSGSAQTHGDLSVEAGGTLTNERGTLSANGAHGAAHIRAAVIDNTAGRLVNAGDGITTVDADAILNAGGTLGGNGALTVHAQRIANTTGGVLEGARHHDPQRDPSHRQRGRHDPRRGRVEPGRAEPAAGRAGRDTRAGPDAGHDGAC